jgi:ubiquitin-like protein Pup
MAEIRRTERSDSRSAERADDLDQQEVEPILPAQNEALDEDVDAILEEIDAVLEENAEDFVKSFVQKGGQ